MKIVTIIQARMGSTRLPGKVLLDIEGETTLSRVVGRVRQAELVGEIVVATSRQADDDAIVRESERMGVQSFRGSEEDVLDRYYRSAKEISADVVVRITSDCPLIDPGVIDKTIQSFLDRRPDYASNALVRTYPRGLDTEILTFEALARSWTDAVKSYQRSHVTAFIYENPERFDILPVCGPVDHSNHRWTLDTPEDLRLIRALYARLGNHVSFDWLDVLKLFEDEPKLAEINRGVLQKALQEG